MPIQIPRREPTAAPAGAQARTRVATQPAAQVDPQARFRRAKAHCGACGEPWFGQVAFCPYCGTSASAAAGAAKAPLLQVDFDPLDATPTPVARPVRPRPAETRLRAKQADVDWKRWVQPIGLGMLAAVFVFVAGLLAVSASKHVAPKAAVTAPADETERSDTSAPNVEAAASTPAVSRAVVEPPPRVVAPAPQPRVAEPAARTQGPAATPPPPMATPAPSSVTARTPQPQVAAPAPPAQVTAPAPPAQAAAPTPPAQAAQPAQPGRNRALCSPASEAAGLCNAQ
jgi:hypothetical protein